MAGYQQQLDPGASPVYSGATAEQFGASIGRSIGELADSTEHFHDVIKQRDREEEATAAGLQFAKDQATAENAVQDARLNAAPGAKGHTDLVGKTVTDLSTASLGGIKDRRVRQAYQQRYAELHSSLTSREYGWEAGQRVDHIVTNFDEQGTQSADTQQINPTASGLVTALGGIETSGRLLEGVGGPDAQNKLILGQQQKVAYSWGQATADKDPDVLLGTLKTGLLNPYLKSEQINTLRDSAETELRRRAAAAHQAQATGEAAAREQIELFKHRVSSGETPPDTDFTTVKDLAVKYNLQVPAYDLDVLQSKIHINKETRTWTPTQWSTAVNDLEAKGDKRTSAENIRLDQLKTARPAREAAFNNDPFQAASLAGSPPPAVDFSNPTKQAIEQRVTWARSYAASTGLQAIPYLGRDEMKAFRDRAAAGPAGQLEVASTVRGLFGVGIGQEITRQLDPGNKDLQLMVGLPPKSAEWYKRGIDALQRNPKLVDRDAARLTFQEYAPSIPQELRTPIYNAAMAIVAGHADTLGRTELEGDEFASAFRTGVARAAGMLTSPDGVSTGGFADWRGRKVWLPTTMSSTDFQRRMTRSSPTAILQAVSDPQLGAPRYMAPDGKLTRLSPAQLTHIGDYALETVSPGVFNLVGADGGHLVGKNGKPWSFDARKLHPWSYAAGAPK